MTEGKAHCRTGLLKKQEKTAGEREGKPEGGLRGQEQGWEEEPVRPFLMLCVCYQEPALSGPPGLSVWSVQGVKHFLDLGFT